MKIGIDCYFMSDEKSAYGKAQFNILKWLTYIDVIDEFYIFTDMKMIDFLPKKSNYKIISLKRNGNNFLSRTRSIRRAIKLRRIELDIFIETTEIAPKFSNKVKIFTLQHDFSNGTIEKKLSIASIKGKIYRLFQKSSIIRSDSIFCNSEFTRNELLALYPQKQNVLLAPHGCDSIYENASSQISLSDPQKLNLPDKFFLFVGRISVRHKNIPLLLKAFLEFSFTHKDIFLIIASTERPTKIEKKLINLIGERLILFNGLSTNEIAFLYSKATAFVFPSYYEGFGVPILEAQHMKCPLILNNIPVFREISGECAIFFDGTIQSLLNAMENVLKDERRYSIVNCGYENSKKYSWKGVASAIYKKIHMETDHE